MTVNTDYHALKKYNKVLGINDQGMEVLQLQEALTELGHDVGPPDGIYGVKTKEGVEAFQASLFVTGSVSPYLAGILVKRAEAVDVGEDVKILKKSSPNYSNRHGVNIDTLVYHYTASVNEKATDRTFMSREGRARVSAHFNILKNGTIVQYVDLDKAAWHAGGGSLPDGSGNMNYRSIGIEIENWGLLTRTKGAYYHWNKTSKYNGTPYIDDQGYVWDRYTREQIEALVNLGRELHEKYTFDHFVGHQDLNVGKIDPGPAFPGEEVTKLIKNKNLSIKEVLQEVDKW